MFYLSNTVTQSWPYYLMAISHSWKLTSLDLHLTVLLEVVLCAVILQTCNRWRDPVTAKHAKTKQANLKKHTPYNLTHVYIGREHVYSNSKCYIALPSLDLQAQLHNNLNTLYIKYILEITPPHLGSSCPSWCS